MTKGTCSTAINVEVENGIIQSVEFVGGCHGNTQGVAALVKGMEVEDAEVKENLEKEEFIRAQQTKLQKKTRTRAPRKAQ